MDLAERLADDLDGAFPLLLDALGGAVHSLALRTCGPEAAEDVAQETFLRAYAALGRYGPARVRRLDLRPWVVTIALNVLRNRARSAGRRPESAARPEQAPPPEQGGPDARLEGSDARAALAAALLRLPVPARQAVVLRHVLGFDTAGTAAALGRPAGTVKAQVARSLARLRRDLNAAGYTVEDQ